ncbi:unnamed protein product [Ectocarpus sp. 8 AP-2014]
MIDSRQQQQQQQHSSKRLLIPVLRRTPVSGRNPVRTNSSPLVVESQPKKS